MRSMKLFFNSHRRALLSLGVVLATVVVGVIASQTSAQLRAGNNSLFGTPESNLAPAAGRTFRVVSTNAAPGSEVTVSVELDSQGDEVAASFTLNFDPAVLNTPVLTIGAGAPAGGALTVNPNEAGSGRVGILVDSSNSFVLSPPARQALTVKFNVAANAPSGPTTVSFGNSPTRRSTSSPFGVLLPTFYEDGTITIAAVAPSFTVGGRVTTPAGLNLRNAVVTLIDSDNVRRTATTGTFGLYSFDSVQSGRTYTVSVASKRYRFAARVLTVTDNISNLDFTGLE